MLTASHVRKEHGVVAKLPKILWIAGSS